MDVVIKLPVRLDSIARLQTIAIPTFTAMLMSTMTVVPLKQITLLGRQMIITN